MPICENLHWYLLLIAIEQTEGAKRAYILVADSWAKEPRTHAAKIIQLYLEHVSGGEVQTTMATLGVRQQQNGYDCGIHTIHNGRRILHLLGKHTTIDADKITAVLNAEPMTQRADVRATIDTLIRGETAEVSSPDISSGSSSSGSSNCSISDAEEGPADGEGTQETVVFEIPSGHGVALDGYTMMVNATDSPWGVTTTAVQEIERELNTVRPNMLTKEQARLRFIRNIAPERVQFCLRRKFGRVIRQPSREHPH